MTPTIDPRADESVKKGERKPNLRYLQLVEVAATRAVGILIGIFGFAKDNAGPLRPGVDAISGAVRGIVGPTYERFHGVPRDLLAFVDGKIDEAVQELHRHTPEAVKTTSAHVYLAAREITEQARLSGVKGAACAAYCQAEPVARYLYVQFEPVAEQFVIATWRTLQGLPFFDRVAEVLIPVASYSVDKYNSIVSLAAENYPVVQCLAVPKDRIAEVFGKSKFDKPVNGDRKANAKLNLAAAE